MLSLSKNISLSEGLLYIVHLLGLFYFIGFPENIMKIVVLGVICLHLIYNYKLLKVPKHFIYLYLAILLYILSADSFSTFITYSPPILIFFLGSHLSSIYERLPKHRLYKILENLIVLSFLGTVMKLFIFGIDESYLVGFMTMSAGEIGVLFPAFMMIFFSKSNIRLKKYYILLIYLFLFGVVNEKRSVIFILPALYFILHSISYKKLLLYTLFLYPVAISVIPSLNRDEKIFGSVDFVYPLEYSLNYLTSGYSSELQGSFEEALYDKNVQFGRVALASAIVSEITDEDLSKIMLGFGLGMFTNKYSLDNGIQDNLFWQFGFRGNLNSFLLISLESGLLCFFFFFLFIFKHIKYYSRSKYFYAFLFLYVFDVFLYSQTLIKTLPLNLYLFTLIPAFFDEYNRE